MRDVERTATGADDELARMIAAIRWERRTWASPTGRFVRRLRRLAAHLRR